MSNGSGDTLSTTNDHTAAFAERLVGITAASLTDVDLEQVHILFLDFCGVAFAGSLRPHVQKVRRWAASRAVADGAGVIGSDVVVAPETAALVNGMAAHSFELDDTHDRSMSHPGAVVFSAALAVARECNASGAEFAAAVVAGYEAMTRVGMAANAGELIRRGYHPTALVGVFGAAAAAAKLISNDVDLLLRSWGHALSLAAGSMQFSDESAGTDVKRLHPGYAAHGGVLSAQLASAGVSAPARALDGKYGVLALYGVDADPRLLKEEGTAYQIHAISLKPYSCCRLFHSLIDAIGEATLDVDVSPDNISRLVVRAPRIVVEQHMMRKPQSSMAAQYSMPYAVGATLAFGPTDFTAYESQHFDDTRISSYSDIVEVQVDRQLEDEYPNHLGSGIDIEFRDGSIRSVTVLDSKGTPSNPMSRPSVVDKLKGLFRDTEALDADDLDEAVGSALRAESLQAIDRRIMRPCP